MTATGAAMLWVGWYGFNGGSQLAADGGAGMAIAATHIAAATAGHGLDRASSGSSSASPPWSVP